MAKGAKAACPVCGVEISDPDYGKNRARNRVLKCPNCLNRLEWVKPAWERGAQIIEWLVVAIAPIAFGRVSGRMHNPSLRHWGDYTVFVIAGLAAVRVALQKTGMFAPKLKVTDRPYVDREPFERLGKGEREMKVAGPTLRTDWRGVPTQGFGVRRTRWLGFLRGKGGPPLEEPVRFESETGK